MHLFYRNKDNWCPYHARASQTTTDPGISIGVATGEGLIDHDPVIPRRGRSAKTEVKTETVPVIEIRKLDFSYTADPVLEDINLLVEPGDFVTIVGGNGSGKSTLLKLIIGALKHSEGSIKLWGMSPQSESAMNRLAYVPQNIAVRSVGFPITCREMVAQALQREFGFFKIPRRKHYRSAEKKLREMGLGSYLKTPMKELSGGLQQRVMICRALMTEPDLLVLDEPTAGIDQDGKDNFIRILARLNSELKTTIVLVTHEFDVLRELEQQLDVYRINEGKLTHAAI